MGTMTVGVNDMTETKFRKAVKNTLGEGKGKLGKALTEAMEKWAEEAEQEELRKRALARLEKGYHLGGKTYKHRSELYERGQ